MSVDRPAAAGEQRQSHDAQGLLDLVRHGLDRLSGAYVLVCDTDLRILLVRGELLDLLGVTPGGAEGLRLPEVVEADRWDVLAPVFESVLAGAAREIDVRTPEGGRTFHLVVTPVAGPDGAVVGAVAMAVDDTERRRVHEALVDSEERFRLLAENSSDFVMRTTADGVIEWISDSITGALGWEPDEMVGKRSLDFAHPDVLATVVQDTSSVNVGATVSGRIQVRCKDGSYKWMARTLRPVYGAAGEVIARVSGWHDAEAEVAAERALIQSEEMFRLAMGGLDVDGVTVAVSLSIGGVLARPDEPAEELLKRADRAVYRAERAGRDQVSIDGAP